MTFATGMTVTAESSPIIDVKGNTVSATPSRNTIERMPKGRDFTSILRVAPGAQQESKAGGTQIDGASLSGNGDRPRVARRALVPGGDAIRAGRDAIDAVAALGGRRGAGLHRRRHRRGPRGG